MRRVVAFGLCLLATSGCGSREVVESTTAVERGEAWASDPGFAETRYNAFACTTCHPVAGAAGERILPGAPLAGAARRSSFWGGRFLTLSEAVDTCAQRFMRAAPLDPAAPRWVDLWAWLANLDGAPAPWPFDVQGPISDLPKGDASGGQRVWDSACRSCHGDAKTGAGRLKDATGRAVATVVPVETLAEHAKDGPSIVRQVVIEKVRHGSFLGFAGVMPPFSKQALTDSQIADLLSYLGLYD